MTDTTTPAIVGPRLVIITIGGKRHGIKFSMNVMRDWGKFAGRPSNEFGLVLSEDHVEAFTSIIMCAVRRFVPELAEITQDQIADVLDDLSQEEADAIAGAITEATTTVPPLLAALGKQMAALTKAAEKSQPNEGGAVANVPSASSRAKSA